MKPTVKITRKLNRRVSAKDRIVLERKVEAGTKKAIKEYREVFLRLAEYDKT